MRGPQPPHLNSWQSGGQEEVAKDVTEALGLAERWSLDVSHLFDHLVGHVLRAQLSQSCQIFKKRQ